MLKLQEKYEFIHTDDSMTLYMPQKCNMAFDHRKTQLQVQHNCGRSVHPCLKTKTI